MSNTEMRLRKTTTIPPTKDDGEGYETSEPLLVWVKNHGVSFGYVARSNGSNWRWRSNSYNGIPITHWMPLPEPPKED